jgi:hypothetical protein
VRGLSCRAFDGLFGKMVSLEKYSAGDALDACFDVVLAFWVHGLVREVGESRLRIESLESRGQFCMRRDRLEDCFHVDHCFKLHFQKGSYL